MFSWGRITCNPMLQKKLKADDYNRQVVKLYIGMYHHHLALSDGLIYIIHDDYDSLK